MAYARKDYLGSRAETTLDGGINASTTSITITSATGWPTIANGGHYAVIDPGTTSEEKVLVTARTTTSLTVTRGVDGTTGVSHSSGATIRPSISGVDFDEANYMVAETVGNITSAGDLLVGAGTNDLTRLAQGSASTILAVNSGGTLGYTTAATAMFADSAVTNAKLAGMTRGTVKVGNSSGAASDLALGTSGYYLKSDGTDAVWASFATEWTTVTKGSDESVSSSTVLQDDNELFFTAANGTVYVMQLFLVFSATRGIRIAAGEDTTIRGGLFVQGLASGIATISNIETDLTAFDIHDTPSGTLSAIGYHTGAGGTFKLQWAQGASSGTASTVKAGSYLRYRAIT